jgi:alpha-tubulin suppressor-like RCC1 family protein
MLFIIILHFFILRQPGRLLQDKNERNGEKVDGRLRDSETIGGVSTLLSIQTFKASGEEN